MINDYNIKYFNMAKLKKRSMDAKLVASLEPHELKYIADKFKISIRIVRQIVKEVGRSRRKIYAAIRELQNS